jgi:UDP-galactopyranose mutase
LNPQTHISSGGNSPVTWDYLIVGAGYAGAVLAERLASQCGATCLVIDKRTHIGGNAHDHYDKAGVLLHTYGPHYFRSNSERIVAYLSQFTEWHPVEYKILSWAEGRHWQFPINLNTFEQLIGRPSTSGEMESTLAEWRVPIENPANSEEVIVSQVGTRLYEMFFKNYTRKQWRREPSELDASVCGRIPIRTNRDDRYLSEKFQALPKDGYTAMFARMLDHPNITVQLGTGFREARQQVKYRHLIFTGPVDEYFDHCFGQLPYRSLRFEPETLNQEFFQPTMQVNYPNDHEFTRIVEIKHATGQQIPVTTIVREYPDDYGPGKEPYYPIPAPDAKALYDRYAALAEKEEGVSFVGRLATYRYYNMDQVVGMALTEFEKLKSRHADLPRPNAHLTGPAK